MGEARPYGKLWAGGIAAVLLVFLVAGGTSAPLASVRLILSGLSLAVILAAAWRLRNGLPSGLATAGLLLIGLMLTLMIAQQLPLPAAVIALLPGRAAFAAASEAAGLGAFAGPISLAPAMTRNAMLATLPGIAMFAAALAVPARNRLLIAGTIAAAAIISALLGIMQRFMGDQAWHLYDFTAGGTSSGLFANRNFFAALLSISIPMLGAFVLAAVREQHVPGWLAAVLGLVYLSIILAGLAAAASRAGIILSMAAIVATAFLPWGSLNSLRTRTSRRVMIYGILTFMFIFGQFGLVGLLRLTETDALTDYRTTMGQVSWNALWAMFPAGSGFGTFVPVYQMFETPAALRASFVNHAHNDWLEIVLEGGIAALLLLTAFLGWYATAALRIWTRRSEAPGDLFMAAASISAALLMLHSIVDYPLRTPALMAVFGLCAGLMASAFTIHRRSHQSWEAMAASAPVASAIPRKPITPFKPARPTTEGAASSVDKL